MRTARRFVKDESGMTMGLAIIMIVLIGVMGAGLLTFVSRDLNTVIEENRGQRAFEVADAGIGAAKRQLASDCVGDTELHRSLRRPRAVLRRRHPVVGGERRPDPERPRRGRSDDSRTA